MSWFCPSCGWRIFHCVCFSSFICWCSALLFLQLEFWHKMRLLCVKSLDNTSGSHSVSFPRSLRFCVSVPSALLDVYPNISFSPLRYSYSFFTFQLHNLIFQRPPTLLLRLCVLSAPVVTLFTTCWGFFPVTLYKMVCTLLSLQYPPWEWMLNQWILSFKDSITVLSSLYPW